MGVGWRIGVCAVGETDLEPALKCCSSSKKSIVKNALGVDPVRFLPNATWSLSSNILFNSTFPSFSV